MNGPVFQNIDTFHGHSSLGIIPEGMAIACRTTQAFRPIPISHRHLHQSIAGPGFPGPVQQHRLGFGASRRYRRRELTIGSARILQRRDPVFLGAKAFCQSFSLIEQERKTCLTGGHGGLSFRIHQFFLKLPFLRNGHTHLQRHCLQFGCYGVYLDRIVIAKGVPGRLPWFYRLGVRCFYIEADAYRGAIRDQRAALILNYDPNGPCLCRRCIPFAGILALPVVTVASTKIRCDAVFQRILVRIQYGYRSVLRCHLHLKTGIPRQFHGKFTVSLYISIKGAGILQLGQGIDHNQLRHGPFGIVLHREGIGKRLLWIGQGNAAYHIRGCGRIIGICVSRNGVC